MAWQKDKRKKIYVYTNVCIHKDRDLHICICVVCWAYMHVCISMHKVCIPNFFLTVVNKVVSLSLFYFLQCCQRGEKRKEPPSLERNWEELGEGNGPHSSTLAWKIPWTEEPGGLQSMGSLRVRHDWATSLSLFTFMHWRRKWQPTPVFMSGESQGPGSLVGCSLWGHTESDTTEVT